MVVQYAGQPEIFLANQRDEAFEKKLANTISDVVRPIVGAQTAAKLHDGIQATAKLLYGFLTSVDGLQTLGEEHTGTLQWKGNNIPTTKILILSSLLECFGDQVLREIILKLELLIKKQPDSVLSPRTLQLAIQNLERLRKLLPILRELHRSLFFLEGSFLSFPKRILGIMHVLRPYWPKETSVIPSFQSYSVVSLAHQLGRVAEALQSKTVLQNLSESALSDDNCPLCLSVLRNISCIPCGHVFCWECIVTSLMTRNSCPLCREQTVPSRVVLLRN